MGRFFASFAAGACVLCATVAHATIEQAKSADSFVDAQGVNTHYINSVYTGQNAYSFPQLDQKLADLGIRHVRDNTAEDPTNPAGFGRIDSLYSTYGIRSDLVFGSTINSPATVVNLLKAHPGYEAIEGLNESDFATRSYNGFTDNPAAHSYPATIAYQNDLYAAVKGDVQTAGVKVFSPAMGNSGNSQYLSSASPSFQFESMHSYPTAHNPTFALDTKIGQTNLMASPSKPIVATETGYYTKTADGGQVSETAMMKYVPRLFGEYFNRGIVRTYDYELVDENPTSDRESNFGLLHWDLTPKPAYTALKNLNDLVKEPAAGSFSPGTLNYTISAPASVHHTLLEKGDGTFFLLAWNEVTSWNLSGGGSDITNPDVAVTLTLADQFAEAKIFLPGVSADPTATYLNPTSINLNVPDQMMVVELSHVPEAGGSVLIACVFAAIGRRRR